MPEKRAEVILVAVKKGQLQKLFEREKIPVRSVENCTLLVNWRGKVEYFEFWIWVAENSEALTWGWGVKTF